MDVIRRTLLASLAVAITLGSPLGARGNDERAAVPEAAEISKAEKLVAELFGSEYAKTSAASRIALAGKLLEQAEQTTNDAVGRYVLLRDARDFAAKGGDALLAAKAADTLTTEYKLGDGAAHAPLAALADAPIAADKARTAAEVLLSAGDTALAAGEWDEAIALLKAAGSTARKAKSFAMSNDAKSQLAQAEKGKAEAAKVQGQVATLKTNPDDPAANLAVGRYLCLVKHDWDAALPLLVKGASGPLKEAVDKDLKAAEGDDAAQLDAADAWYDLASRSSAEVKASLQVRAQHWYQLALSAASGLTKAKIEKRLTELQTVAAGSTEKSRLWAFVRKKVSEKKLKRGALVGGAFSHTTFEEIPEGGGILIGFRYTTKSKGQYPGVVQPIFLTAGGEVLGKIYGTAERGAEPQVTKAKPGYAVGALFIRGGGGFDAFQPIYMRIKGNALDTSDRYDGPHVGGEGGGSGTLGGDGNLVVGIHGKVSDQGSMATMSPVLVSDQTASSQTPPVQGTRPSRVRRPIRPGQP
jgi:hypothetical protein